RCFISRSCRYLIRSHAVIGPNTKIVFGFPKNPMASDATAMATQAAAASQLIPGLMNRLNKASDKIAHNNTNFSSRDACKERLAASSMRLQNGETITYMAAKNTIQAKAKNLNADGNGNDETASRFIS